MKISLALGPQKPLDRATAWGCLTTNLFAPGSGSLVAGRKVGYAQLAVALFGLAVTMILGIRFFIWYSRNYERLRQVSDDPFATLKEVFVRLMRGPGTGLLIFLVALVWALITSLQIVADARRNSAPPPAPPRLR